LMKKTDSQKTRATVPLSKSCCLTCELTLLKSPVRNIDLLGGL
jgi:hypothetical protein